jgi:hypothetical protein
LRGAQLAIYGGDSTPYIHPLQEEPMKRALTTMAFALIAGALALPFGDGRHANDPSEPALIPRHGDYPVHSPIAARRDVSPQELACLTPGAGRSPRRIG